MDRLARIRALLFILIFIWLVILSADANTIQKQLTARANADQEQAESINALHEKLNYIIRAMK